ncbi:uncharacterized protein LOC115978629 [Quercus lobata]|uniref:uncharacterized protein LOC115978629 n=1 Tax=Quercus lobata TaxID=97700 RepID=UPI00124649EE|nr:uncharacterized protein LOC115978629 [Quercus lobata]
MRKWCGFLGAMSKKVHFPLGAMEVEAMAMEEGIQLARDLGLKDIDMESNAQMVVLAVGGTDPGPCSIQKIVEGAKQGLSAFSSWSCSHVRRQSNMAAHLMAKEASNVQECLIWVEDTPSVIVSQIHMDVIALDSCPK